MQAHKIRTKLAELEKAPEAPTVEQGDRPIVKGKITAAKTPTFEYDVDQINEYSDEGAIAKAQFHKDATAHLRRLGKALGGKSLYPKSKTGISANTAGIAVAGDIYGKWKLPNGKTVEVHLSDTALANSPGTPVTKSGVAMIVNIDKGPNNWLDAKMPVDELTAKINQLAGVEQAPAQEDTAKPKKDYRAGWWDKDLTPKGRRDLIKTAGLDLPDKVLWQNLSEKNKKRLIEAERQVDQGIKQEVADEVGVPVGSAEPGKGAAPVRFEIGDNVRPKPGSGISKKNAGRIKHIQRDIDGNESIKTENTGNMHFNAEDWELVPQEKESAPAKEEKAAPTEAPAPPPISFEQYLAKTKEKKTSGIELTEQVEVEETGQRVTVKKDVSAALREVEAKIETYNKLLDCLA
jgi:hypothetical protein